MIYISLILPYIIVRLKLFLYIKKWLRPGGFVALRALAVVLYSNSLGLNNSSAIIKIIQKDKTMSKPTWFACSVSLERTYRTHKGLLFRPNGFVTLNTQVKHNERNKTHLSYFYHLYFLVIKIYKTSKPLKLKAKSYKNAIEISS